jgi:hypothetical protein
LAPLTARDFIDRLKAQGYSEGAELQQARANDKVRDGDLYEECDHEHCENRSTCAHELPIPTHRQRRSIAVDVASNGDTISYGRKNCCWYADAEQESATT